jgi:phage gp36-like protein
MPADDLLKLRGIRGLTQGTTKGGGAAKAALDAASYCEESKYGSWGAQLPLKQITLLLLLFCCFLGFFLRCHVDLLTSYGSWLFVQTAFVSALPMR